MPFDALPHLDAAHAALALNARFAPTDAQGLMAHVLRYRPYGRLALVSSFGAESVVLLHMAARIDPATPVLFLDTGKLFDETLAYHAEIVDRLGLGTVERIRPAPGALAAYDPAGKLHAADRDTCCALRKVEPLAAALERFAGWITGRKRVHGGARAALDLTEAEGGRLKLNPLAHWKPADIAAYMEGHDLPRHPLTAQGYGSLGCAPCTSPLAPGRAHAGRALARLGQDRMRHPCLRRGLRGHGAPGMRLIVADSARPARAAPSGPSRPAARRARAHRRPIRHGAARGLRRGRDRARAGPPPARGTVALPRRLAHT